MRICELCLYIGGKKKGTGTQISQKEGWLHEPKAKEEKGREYHG